MKKRKLYIIINIIFLAFLILNTQYSILNTSYAQENNCQANLDKANINAGEAVILTIICYETEDMPPPELPVLEGFKSRYLNSLTITTKHDYTVVKATKHRYMLIPEKTGNLAINPISFESNGKVFTTQPLSIVVAENSPFAKEAPQAMEAENPVLPQDERAFVVLKVEKNKLYLNEPAELEIRFYVNKKTISLTDVEYPVVKHDNFSIGEFADPQRKQQELKDNYYEVLIFKNLIFPIKAGSLKLGPAKIKCQILTKQEKSGIGISGEITDSEYEYTKAPIEFASPVISVNVLDFPGENKPKSFSGAVGSYDLDIDITPKEITAGGVLTLTVKITGSGNLSMIPSPLVATGDFKIYQPQIDVKKAIKIFRYTLMPQKSGILTIDKIDFSFFNPQTQAYQEITKGPFQIKVFEAAETAQPAAPTEETTEPYSLKEDLGKDIVYIKDTPGDIKEKGDYTFNKGFFWALQPLPFIVFLCIFLAEKRLKFLRQDKAYARYLNAFKRAKKSLNKAAALLRQDKYQQFCAAIFNALKTYLGDKFYMPSGGITIKDIEKIAQAQQLDDDITSPLRKCFTEYDNTVFVPSEFNKEKMLKLFGDISDVVTAIEKQERAKKANKAKRLPVFLLSLILTLMYANAASAESNHSKELVHANFEKANSFYQQEKFKEAIGEYEEITNTGLESANIYYNLANAYFKTGAIGKAILNYERAKRLSPGDADVTTNLEYANSLIVDRSIQLTVPNFIKFVNTAGEAFNLNSFCMWLFIINIAAFMLLTINLFLPVKNKFLIFMATMLLLLLVCGFSVLGNRMIVVNSQSEAVVVVPEAECKFGPVDNATTHFKLYEGSKIVILASEGPWSKVRRFDAKIGWVKKDCYERI